MIPTADPEVVIEEYGISAAGTPFVRYRRSDGARWEVWGRCDRRGDCLIGTVVQTPDGPVTVRDRAHIEELKRQLGRERIDSELDVPVGPGFKGCCPLTIIELA